MNPPLFHIKDIKKYCLLQDAVQWYCMDLKRVKYFIDLDPSCVYHKDNYNRLPIHHFSWDSDDIVNEKLQLETAQYLIQASLSYSISNKRIGGLFTKEPNDDDYVINNIVKGMGIEKTWDLIERSLSKHKQQNNLPCILLQTIKHTPEYCSEVIKRFPKSVHVRDVNNGNRLPIHVALETGMKWSIELEYLFVTSKEFFKDVDPLTKFPLFVLAAMGKSCDLRVVFEMLQEHPEQVEMLKSSY